MQLYGLGKTIMFKKTIKLLFIFKVSRKLKIKTKKANINSSSIFFSAIFAKNLSKYQARKRERVRRNSKKFKQKKNSFIHNNKYLFFIFFSLENIYGNFIQVTK